MTEHIEEIDWKGNIVAVHPKDKLKEKMFPHKVALVIPKTEDSKLILCRRAKNKHPFPDTWCCAIGGKVSAGEEVETAAHRETKEETDTSLRLEHVVTFPYNRSDYQAMFTVFTTRDACTTDHFTPNQEEIQYLQEFSYDELETRIQQQPESFAPTFLAALQEFTNLT